MEKALTRMELTVQITTKLNHSHLVNGKSAYLLPCLGRSEEDIQAGGPQTVTMEDRFSCIHGSIARRKPASEHLRSELAIVAGLARDLIAETYPDEFHDFNARMFTPGGFYGGNAARERIWKTKSGKAELTTPTTLTSTGSKDAPGRYRLLTMRSNDPVQHDYLRAQRPARGIEGTREVLLMNPDDIARRPCSGTDGFARQRCR